jgi:hypothetical protein
MAKSPSIAHDSALVANLVQQLGGKIVEGDTLKFDLALRDVGAVVPKLNELGVGVRKLQEWTESDHRGPIGIVRLVCTRTPADQVRGQLENSYLSKFGF